MATNLQKKFHSTWLSMEKYVSLLVISIKSNNNHDKKGKICARS